jgi:hypothetical protein
MNIQNIVYVFTCFYFAMVSYVGRIGGSRMEEAACALGFLSNPSGADAFR